MEDLERDGLAGRPHILEEGSKAVVEGQLDHVVQEVQAMSIRSMALESLLTLVASRTSIHVEVFKGVEVEVPQGVEELLRSLHRTATRASLRTSRCARQTRAGRRFLLQASLEYLEDLVMFPRGTSAVLDFFRSPRGS